MGGELQIQDATFENNCCRGGVSAAAAVFLVTASVQVTSSVFLSNSVFGYGWCRSDFDGVIRCPIGFGGAVVAATGDLKLDKCFFEWNRVECENIGGEGLGCMGQGGAVSALGNGVVSIMDSSCSRNRIISCSGFGCAAAGGCFYGGDTFSPQNHFQSTHIFFKKRVGTWCLITVSWRGTPLLGSAGVAV